MENWNQHTVFATTAAVATVAAVGFALTGKKSPLINDMKKIGTLVQDVPKTLDLEVPAANEEYDVIIVGGGTSGCVLASRLSEDPFIRVLLLEAGGSSGVVGDSKMPLGIQQLFGSKVDWNLMTTPQENAGGTEKYWPRGKMLGGCSAMNAMIYHYGSPSDYDEWPAPWKYKDFHKYFLKYEKYVPHKLFQDVDASLRSSAGKVQVGHHGHFSPITRKFIEACISLGIPQSHDINTVKGTIGVTKLMTYIDPKGQRVTTESSYLTPDVLARPNLTVAIYAHVTQILFDHTGGKPRAVGVEFASSGKGQRFRARARKEVVLSAGAIHSPQMLMLSGIGPAEELKKHAIPVVSDLSGVGANLLDHACVTLLFRDKSGSSLNYLLSKSPLDVVRSLFTALQYFLTGKGPLSSNAGEGGAFVRSDDPTLFPPEEFPGPVPDDATSGPDCPDIEVISLPIGLVTNKVELPIGPLFNLKGILLRPTSKGTLTLRSSNPFDPPVIDPNYLATKHDVDVMVRATRLMLRMARAEPLASIVGITENLSALDHRLDGRSDEEVEQVVRTRLETLYHPTSTARMASVEDGGVVDPNLRVYGVDALRVVDASVFPTIMAGHTAAPCIALAEKAAELISQSF